MSKIYIFEISKPSEGYWTEDTPQNRELATTQRGYAFTTEGDYKTAKEVLQDINKRLEQEGFLHRVNE